MRKGHLFEFKSGHYGIEFPNNIAVCLGMSKKGKKHYIVAFTINGKNNIHPQHVTRKKIDHPDLGEEIYDSLTLLEKLRTIISDIRGYEKKKGKKFSQRKRHNIHGRKLIDKDTAVKEIWLGLDTGENEILNAYEIAAKFQKTKAPSASRVDMIRNIINDSITEELPYFNIHKNKKKFNILSKEEYNKINSNIKNLKKIFDAVGKYKKRKAAEMFRSSDTGTLSQKNIRSIFGNRFEDWILEIEKAEEDVTRKNLHRLFNSICRQMEGFVKRDDWSKDMGRGGNLLVKLDNFDPKRYMVQLARLVTGLKKVTYSTLFTCFLIIMGYWTMEKASRAYIERFIVTKEFDFKLGYPRVFDEKMLKRKADTKNENELKKRVDLRDLYTVTVDPVDAKDFDDAISIEKDGNKTVLYVHIADVSHYVSKGSPLDKEAYYRCTSVYLPDTVLPMLPEILSNDYCSLREKVERFAVSTRMVYDENLRLVDFDINPSIINVDRNLSYDMVLDHYHKKLEPYKEWIDFSRELRKKRKQLKLETAEMKIHIKDNKVEKKMKRGNAATEMIECFMVSTNEVIAMYVSSFTADTIYRVHSLPDTSRLDRFNSIVDRLDLDLKKFEDSISEKNNSRKKEDKRSEQDISSSYGFNIRIEGNVDDELVKAMGMNGVSVANSGKKSLITGLYEKNNFRNKLREILLKKEKSEGKGNYVEEMKVIINEQLGTLIDLEKREYLLENINDVLEDINNTKEDERLKELLNVCILRTLSLAIYSPENIGHFGLASDCYSHFTSPIRRYADLVVHRIIKVIKENNIAGTIVTKNGKPDEKLMKKIEWETGEKTKKHEGQISLQGDEALSISERCSDQSRNADKFEHVMNDVCTCMDIMFDENYLRSTHSGIVSGIIAGGVFVDLGRGVEGFIPRKKITRDRVSLNDKETELILENNIDSFRDGKRWKSFKNNNRDRNRNSNGKRNYREDNKRILMGIGDKILVKIKKICIEKGQLEFRLC